MNAIAIPQKLQVRILDPWSPSCPERIHFYSRMFYCTGPAKSQISSPRVLRILAPHLPRNNDGYDYTSQEFPEPYVNLESNRKRGGGTRESIISNDRCFSHRGKRDGSSR